MNFVYKAKDLNGEMHEGEIESVDIKSATGILRKKRLVIISIDPTTPPASKIIDKFLNRVSFDQQVIFTRQMATMINAGLSLSEAIDILEEQEGNKTLKTALGEISHDIKGGLMFSQSLGKHPDVFPPLYVNLIKSGEVSGQLDEVLSRLAESLEKEREFKSRVIGALIYPILVIAMMIGVTLIMIFWVIPKITSLYKDANIDLPLPTKILIAVSQFMLNDWWMLLIVGVTAAVIFQRWIKTPEGAITYDRLVLKLPIIGKISASVTLTNFSRTLGLLTSAGVPLLEAIDVTEKITSNQVFKNVLKNAYAGVERGLQLSTILINSPIFPRIVGQMARVGEETGKADEVFFKLAEYFESESDNMIKNLTVIIEPIVLIILGIGVAFLVISIILPIYTLTKSF